MVIFLTLLLSNIVVAGCLVVFAFSVTKVWRLPHLAHALWLLVLVKLVTPPIVEVPLPQSILTSIETNAGEDPSAHFSRPRKDSSSPQETQRTMLSRNLLGSTVPHHDADIRSRMSRWQDLAVNWPQWLLAAWSVGTVALTGVAFRRHSRLRGVVAKSGRAEADLREDAQRIAHQMGLPACPRLCVSDARVCPLVAAGWRKSVVLLPGRLLAELTRDQVRALLAHELAHIRRRDHLIRFFELCVLSLHWWNPLAWWASRQLRQVEEECCDAWVVWVLPEGRRAYGQTLVRTVEYLTGDVILPAAAGTAFRSSSFERRIDMILNRTLNPKMSRSAIAIALMVGAIVLPVAVTQVFSADRPTAPDGEGAQVDVSSGESDTSDLSSWARQHGGSYSHGQLVFDRSFPTKSDLDYLKRVDKGAVTFLFIRGHTFSDEQLERFTQLTGIRTLQVLSNGVSSEGLKHLARLRHLRTFEIESRQVDDTGMEYVKDLKTLDRLAIGSSRVTNDGLRVLCEGNLSKLRSLSLSRSRIDDSGLAQLKNFPDLEVLDLGVTNIGDGGLVHIAALPKLRKLNLRKTKITDRGLENLKGMPNLASLNLESTAVSDTGLLHLAQLPNLTEVTLSDTDVTRDGFEKLQAKNPNVTVLFSPVAIIEAGNRPR